MATASPVPASGQCTVTSVKETRRASASVSKPASPMVRFTRKDEDIDAVFDLRAIFQQTFDQLAYQDMPSLLRPKTGKLGLEDHEKVFCVDHKGVGDIFEMRGIDREGGCMVVVRPDQYVAHVLPLGEYAALAGFFDGIFLPVKQMLQT